MGVIKKAIKVMFPKEKWKILRGDKVIITSGKDKGQTGIVTKVIRDERIPKVIVEGRNLVSLKPARRCLSLHSVLMSSHVAGGEMHLVCTQNKRAIKRTADNPGGLISMEVDPLHMLLLRRSVLYVCLSDWVSMQF